MSAQRIVYAHEQPASRERRPCRALLQLLHGIACASDAMVSPLKRITDVAITHTYCAVAYITQVVRCLIHVSLAWSTYHLMID